MTVGYSALNGTSASIFTNLQEHRGCGERKKERGMGWGKNAETHCLLGMRWLPHSRTHGICAYMKRIKSVTVSVWMEEGFLRPYPFQWTSDCCWPLRKWEGGGQGWAFSFEGVATGRLLMWMVPNKEGEKALATIEEKNEEKENQKTNKNNYKNKKRQWSQHGRCVRRPRQSGVPGPQNWVGHQTLAQLMPWSI